ncbi:hypothetical protein LWI29_028902 [Acer saccharum]|uniref:Uncharacterized protein n=1 Tax=Acer saccharum TaxID=4024 RepID=A0AA39T5W6_ACESA|nr:hypothetical protein LWI29_028902 [Acer saccharum]
MGKKDKKQRHQQRGSRRADFYKEEEGYEAGNSYPSDQEQPPPDDFEDEEDEQQEKNNDPQHLSNDMPSKFLLYQQSVQSPKGDISYMLKFFLMYVGGGSPSISKKIFVALLYSVRNGSIVIQDGLL